MKPVDLTGERKAKYGLSGNGFRVVTNNHGGNLPPSLLRLHGQGGDALLEFEAGFEADDEAFGDDDGIAGFLGVAADLRLGLAQLEGAEGAQGDFVAALEAGADLLDEAVDQGEDVLLAEAELVAQLDDEIAFGDVGHVEGGMGNR